MAEERSLSVKARLFAAVLVLSAAATPAFAEDGQALFTQNCSACHQVTGKGIPGAFPALAGDPFVVGPVQPVAKTVLNGRGGMPTFAPDMTDAQIAAALTYVRSSWGNAAPPVTPDQVAKERSASGLPPPENGMQAH